MMGLDGRFTIGELASAAGIGVETVRFYERQGLLERPSKPLHGYRRYPSGALKRIEFIRRAKAVGFALDEIRELLALRARPGSPCKTVRERALAKRDAIDAKLRELESLRGAVQELVDVCTGAVAVEQCSILGALDGLTETEEARLVRADAAGARRSETKPATKRKR